MKTNEHVIYDSKTGFGDNKVADAVKKELATPSVNETMANVEKLTPLFQAWTAFATGTNTNIKAFQKIVTDILRMKAVDPGYKPSLGEWKTINKYLDNNDIMHERFMKVFNEFLGDEK